MLNRDSLITKLEETLSWDVIIIGGGATGLGIALDAATRGFSTLLLEQADFAKGTSSRSTKLVHGGVRYLEQGNIQLVYAALRERGILLRNASHLVKRQSFIIPCYTTWGKLKYIIGLKLYDWLSGRLSFGRSGYMGKKEVLKKLPGINDYKLKGGVEYYDGQFDDARLAINLAQTCVEKGAVVLNYCKVTGLLKDEEGKVSGVLAQEVESGKGYQLQSKVVINATGVFVDDILHMDEPKASPLVKPSQGVHVVIDKSFMNGDSALLVPKTSDGRVLFAVPWHNHILVGTTDTPLEQYMLEPIALKEEIEFILTTIGDYLVRPPKAKDVLSVFAGLRPLVTNQKKLKSTKELSRDHKLVISTSNLITITGGKWTTYRKMAEDTINAVIKKGLLANAPCVSREVKVHGWVEIPSKDYMSFYGSDAENIKALIRETPSLNRQLVDHLPYLEAEVIWAVRNEMARTVEDVLARRLRILFLDAQAAKDAAGRVAELIRGELNRSREWTEAQVNEFLQLADQYLIKPALSKRTIDHKAETN